MIPNIRSDVSYDSGQSPCKRSRVGDHMQDPNLLHHAATSPPQLVVEAPYSNPDFADHCNLIAENTIVCFGMLVDCPVIAASKTTILPASAGDSVIFTAEKFLQHTPTGVLLGNVDDQTSEILSRLKADPDLAYQLTLRRDALAAATNSRLVKGILGYLSVIIYGPMHRFDDVGDFVTQCGRFLEDPVGCNRDVLYMNPQCLFSTHETPVTTFSLSINLQYLVEDIAQSCFDTLAGFETLDPLTETPTPVCLLTDLQSHQKQALTFFMRREQGLHPIEDSVGLWARQLDGRGFTNIITNQTQLEPGPLWRGGLLADEMGLGKTLSIIALIASDHTNDNRQPSQTERTPAREPCSTLVILPLNIISVWISQLESHVRPGELTHFIHHGKNKLRLADGASPPDIVFTTYQTVEREQQKGSSSFNSLRAHFWRRIVLDEAHIIRNHRTSTAQAIAALKAKCRWAISGTPVQNRLTDFLGLFKFLHFAPYNDPRIFDEELQQLWRERPADEAAKTFKKLLSCFMLRRTKAILDLPTRTDKILFVPFSEQEKDYYLRVETPVIELLDQSSGDSLPNAIQQINGLRLICNLGTHAPQRYNQDNPVLVDGSLTAMLGARLSMGEDMCTQCLGSVSLPSTDDELGTATSSDTYYSACGLIYCAACTQLLRFRSSGLCRCTNDATSCPLIPLSSSIRTPRLTPVRGISPSFRYDSDDIKVSSKVCALIEQIKSTPTEKSAVFSFWTTSLDMVERGLSSENIRSVRIDGNVAAKNRVHAIEQLRHNPKVRVILLTISCGACGLDLTAASVIHLLEPQWNPSLEDQAFARAHRLGQTRPVTMIKYIMQDSFEEHILRVQDRKKLLANTLLSDRSAIKELQKLLHEKRDQAGQT